MSFRRVATEKSDTIIMLHDMTTQQNAIICSYFNRIKANKRLVVLDFQHYCTLMIKSEQTEFRYLQHERILGFLGFITLLPLLALCIWITFVVSTTLAIGLSIIIIMQVVFVGLGLYYIFTNIIKCHISDCSRNRLLFYSNDAVFGCLM